MRRHSKRFRALTEKLEHQQLHQLTDAVGLVKQNATAKFDESVDIAIKLGIDPKKTDQLISGTVSLPNGTGKQVRVLVFAKGEKVDEARAAGADFAGFEDLVEKVQQGTAGAKLFMKLAADYVEAKGQAAMKTLTAEKDSKKKHTRL